jgi:hypothetical protein
VAAGADGIRLKKSLQTPFLSFSRERQEKCKKNAKKSKTQYSIL